MGRKIPAKRHRGVRDPIKQNRERFNKIKHKIDNPPQNINEQPVSRSTAQFIKLKNEAKAGTFRPNSGIEDVPRAVKRKNKTEQPRVYKDVPEHKPFRGETARDFLRRVNRATQKGLKEAQYSAKYNVDIIRKDNGEVQVTKRQVDAKGAPTQNKMVKFNAKKKMKKEKKESQKREEQESDNRIFKKDVVEFGEVCHRPPELRVIRKVDKSDGAIARPGRKNLLLNSLLK
ncbi:coiled-coil domain-containing protein 137 [Phlebotomus argentipes]|uniref:coiled-coil domain-containing protein 137 n=1 Tax=Phlebotomus argentipes TaxID=94469 RepID=UPI0028930FF7|nr:coiled-coil domain-containing protein 137 [Phlebotomus argentipes]